MVAAKPAPAGPADIHLTTWDTRTGTVVRDVQVPIHLCEWMAVRDDGVVVAMWRDRAFRYFQPGGGYGLSVVDPDGAVRRMPLPDGHTSAASFTLSPDGRLLAMQTFRHALAVNRWGRQYQTHAPGAVTVYGLPSGRLVRCWPDAERSARSLRFTGPGELLAVADATGRVERLNVTTGRRTHMFTTPPPYLVGARPRVARAAAGLLVLWAVLWLAVSKPAAADAAFAWAVLLAAGWLAVRLLPEWLCHRTPSLRAWVPDFPMRSLVATTLCLAPLLPVLAVGTAWLNRLRHGDRRRRCGHAARRPLHPRAVPPVVRQPPA